VILSLPDVPDYQVAGFVEVGPLEFESAILDPDNLVVVDFFKDDCQPCRVAERVLQPLTEKFTGRAKFFKLNVGIHREFAERWGISMVPVVALFKDGAMVDLAVRAIRDTAVETKILQNL
jgi:thioredoxin 1